MTIVVFAGFFCQEESYMAGSFLSFLNYPSGVVKPGCSNVFSVPGHIDPDSLAVITA